MYLTAPDTGELFGFITNVEEQSAGGGGRHEWGSCWASYPLQNAKGMTLGDFLVPKNMGLILRANRQRRTNPQTGSAVPAEAESQTCGGARQPPTYPTPESHFSKPACSRTLLNPQLWQKDSPKLPLDDQHWRLWPYHVELVFLKSGTNFEKFFSQHFCVSNTVFLTV